MHTITVEPFKFKNKKALSVAVIRAAFFILFFILILLAAWGLYSSKAEATTVSLAESLGYELVEMTNENLHKTLQVVIYNNTVSKKDTIAIAKELREENKQEVVVYASTAPVSRGKEVQFNEEIAYKVTVRDDSVETVDFDVYESVQPERTIDANWDLRANVLDLVTGEVTINVDMDSGLAKEVVLSKAQALSEQILAFNEESGVSSVVFHISAGEKEYVYHSNYFYTIGEMFLSNG